MGNQTASLFSKMLIHPITMFATLLNLALVSFVDKLPPEDRELIRQFLRTNNKPIVERRHVYRAYNPNSIHNTNAIVSTENSDGSRLVKLDDRFYRTVKQIYEDRGSISHFD